MTTPILTLSSSNSPRRSSTGVADPQVEAHEAEVEQVEADHEQPVDRVGEALAAGEDVLEEDPAVAATASSPPRW